MSAPTTRPKPRWAVWLPPPGGRVADGVLQAVVEFPGLGIDVALCPGNPHSAAPAVR